MNLNSLIENIRNISPFMTDSIWRLILTPK